MSLSNYWTLHLSLSAAFSFPAQTMMTIEGKGNKKKMFWCRKNFLHVVEDIKISLHKDKPETQL